MITSLLISMLLTSGAGPSRAAASDSGYVVRVEGLTVYLDLGAEAGAKAGQAFLLYSEDEELKHPKTGKILGRIEAKLAEGRLTEVKPGYSIGTIPLVSPGLKAGSRARLLAPGVSGASVPPPSTIGSGLLAAVAPTETAAAGTSPAAVPTVAPKVGDTALAGVIAPKGGDTTSVVSPMTTTQVVSPSLGSFPGSQGRAPRWKSPILDIQATGIAVADFDGDGAQDLALSDERRVYLFSYPPETSKAKAVFKHPATKPSIVSLEAADLNGNGKAELFASLHNQTFGRVETVVLEIGQDGQWKKTGELPWLVRAHQESDGKSRLAVQQLVDGPFPYSNIYSLSFADGKWGPSKETIPHKGVDWIYSFTTAEIPGSGTAFLFHTSTDRLRVKFADGKSWSTDEAYSQSPNRIGWAGKILECHPSPKAIYGTDGQPGIYLIRNIPAWGGLAQPFGRFAKGQLQRQRWNGLALETDWQSDLAGYSTGMSIVKRPGASNPELAVAVTGTTGRSALWIYDP